MNRKNYIATAKILAKYAMEMRTDSCLALVDDFCDMFAADNSNFSRDKFKSYISEFMMRNERGEF